MPACPQALAERRAAGRQLCVLLLQYPCMAAVLVLDSLATWALVRRMDAAEGLSRKRRLWAALGVNLGLLVLLKRRLSAAPRRGRQRRALAGIVPSGPRQ